MSSISLAITVSLVGTLGAGLIPLFWRNIKGHRVGQIALAASTAGGAVAAMTFLASGSQTLAVFAPPTVPALQFQITALSAIFFLIVSAVACLCAIFAYRYVEMHKNVYDVPSLDFGVALFVFGMQAVLLSSTVVGFMLCWELMSLSSFVLVMADKEVASRKAALLYFVMAQLGAMAILAGFLLIASGNPLASFETLAANAGSLTPADAAFAFVLFFIGFGSKAGLVPLHPWLPEAHPQAPSHVSALMSSAMLKIAVYGFVLVTTAFLPPLATGFSLTVIAVGLVTAVFGILHAATEHDIKRAIAWHSIENLGLIFAMLGVSLFAAKNGLAVLADIGLAAAFFHAINHAIFKSGLFLSTGVIMSQMHTRNIEEMGGLAKRMPLFTIAVCALTLSGAALPPFGTFYDEWLFLQGLVGSLAGATPAVQAVLAATVSVTAFSGGLAIFAMTKLFALPCLGQPRSHEAAEMKEPPASMNGPILFFAAAGLLSGVFATAILRTIGFPQLLEAGDIAPFSVAAGSVAPGALFALIAAAVLCAAAARYYLGGKKVRAYQTWDCGQPITPRMEYTATAFSAPIRFFFRNFIGTRKAVVVTPGPSGGPLDLKREVVFEGRSFWVTRLHEPMARLLHWLGGQARRIQSGSIQTYLLFIFIALAASLLLAI